MGFKIPETDSQYTDIIYFNLQDSLQNQRVKTL